MKKRSQKTQFHRSQIGRAQRYIRTNLGRAITLTEIAKESGSSSYHFVRLFQAYTGETPFDFLRRLRLVDALQMLHEDPAGSVTEIALSIGYETPSAFNKFFKKTLNISPSDFRNLGKEAQLDLVYDLSQPKVPKEVVVNLSSNYEIVNRSTTHYVFLERTGPFAEVAPPTWNEMFPLVFGQVGQEKIGEFLGLSTVDKTRTGEEAMIYEAGVALKEAPEKSFKGLQYKKIKSGKYARFVLTGPYPQIWVAFGQIFKKLAEDRVELRPEYCIENYLNDPKETPEDKLLTELLIPVM